MVIATIRPIIPPRVKGSAVPASSLAQICVVNSKGVLVGSEDENEVVADAIVLTCDAVVTKLTCGDVVEVAGDADNFTVDEGNIAVEVDIGLRLKTEAIGAKEKLL